MTETEIRDMVIEFGKTTNPDQPLYNKEMERYCIPFLKFILQNNFIVNKEKVFDAKKHIEKAQFHMLGESDYLEGRMRELCDMFGYYEVMSVKTRSNDTDKTK